MLETDTIETDAAEANAAETGAAEPDATPAPPRLAFAPEYENEPGIYVREIELARVAPRAPFNTAQFTVEPGVTSAADSHAVHELWIILAGEGELTYDGRRLRVRPSDVVYFEPPKPHWVFNDGAEPLAVMSVWWKG